MKKSKSSRPGKKRKNEKTPFGLREKPIKTGLTSILGIKHSKNVNINDKNTDLLKKSTI